MFMAVGGDVICGVCNGSSGDDANCDQQCRDRGLDVGVCVTLPPGLQVGAYLCICRYTHGYNGRVDDDDDLNRVHDRANHISFVDDYPDHSGGDDDYFNDD
ncbi:hypothetical protein AAVH_07686 [Aphelenchoides avenae]|nr:hypothetical protein AAVH_07686 [Aphelenchus avenae]